MNVAHQFDTARVQHQEKFLKLAKVEPSKLVCCSARSILRIFPYLFSGEGMDYWLNDTNEYLKGRHLLAVWRGAISVYTNIAQGHVDPSVLKREAMDDAVVVPLVEFMKKMEIDSSTRFPDILNVMYAVVNASRAMYFVYRPDGEFVADIYDSFHFSVKLNDEKYAGLVYEKILREVELLKFSDWHERVMQSPLWGDSLDSSGLDKLNALISSVYKIAARYQESDNELYLLLNAIPGDYNSALRGKLSNEHALAFLNKANIYFRKNPIRLDEGLNVENEPLDEQKRRAKFFPVKQQAAECVAREDSLSRQRLVNTLAAFLAHPKNGHHQTIGLLGDWGIGKSSVIRFLKTTLINDHASQSFLFGEFNAWSYEHTDNLQAGIAQEVIKALSGPALSKKRPGRNKSNGFFGAVKFSILKVFDLSIPIFEWLKWSFFRVVLVERFVLDVHGKKVSWLLFLIFIAIFPWFDWFGSPLENFLKYITGSSSISTDSPLRIIWTLPFLIYVAKELRHIIANPLAKELLTYLRLPNYGSYLGTIPVMRSNLEALCRIRLNMGFKPAKRLLFVVDDLDRCSHNGIVKVFEAIRLVLEIDNVIVIIAVDQNIALASLAHHYQELAPYHRLQNSLVIARDYLAKIIHIPIVLGKPDGADIEAYLNKIWAVTTSPEDQKKHDEYLSKTNFNAQSVNEGVGSGDLSIISLSNELTSNPAGDSHPRNKNASSVAKSSDRDSPPNFLFTVLSAQQKTAFIDWLTYFHLTNPRQVKRLNNSYSLLCSYYVSERPIDSLITLDSKVYEVFPFMLTLIVIEYLNSLESLTQRDGMKAVLKEEKKNDFASDALLNAKIVELIQKMSKESRLNLVGMVEPFILPAIEGSFV